MLGFLERHAPPFHGKLTLLTLLAVCAFGGSYWLLKLADPSSWLFRLALAGAPMGFLPWNLALLGALFDPTRGILRRDGWLMRTLPSPFASGLRWFSGVVLTGLLLATPVLILGFWSVAVRGR